MSGKWRGGRGGSDQALQTPLMQLGVAPPQTTPQAPQLALSFERLVSQPFDGVPSQSPRPDMEHVHEPIEQPVVPDEPVPPHAAAQAPQLVALVSRFTQVPEQLTVPAGQPQVPLVHTWVAGQAVPQVPHALHDLHVLRFLPDPSSPHVPGPGRARIADGVALAAAHDRTAVRRSLPGRSGQVARSRRASRHR